MKISITFFLCLISMLTFSQVTGEVSTSSFNNTKLAYSVGNIYMSGQLETGIIAQSLAPSEILSINQKEDEQITLFPNPALSEVTIQHEDLPNEITIYNWAGQQVKQTKHINGKINVSDLADGIYYIRVNQFSISFIKI